MSIFLLILPVLVLITPAYIKMISRAKGTEFSNKLSLQIGDKLLDLSMPLVMGILNITTDSFYSASRVNTLEMWMSAANRMLVEGATILDIGAASSRPGAESISEEEELQRIIPVVKELSSAFPGAILSIDTFRSSIAEKAIKAGAHLINDISAGEFDDKMFETISELGVPYIMMHMQGTPGNMQANPKYTNVVDDIKTYFEQRLDKLFRHGIVNVLLDPGFGFGKTLAHNYEILRRLDEFSSFGFHIVAGLSRKSMIYKVLNSSPEDALNGTTVMNTLALLNGANILRVHDVREAMEAIKLVGTYNNPPV
jgi:dihydropteroate synthase